jgi:hypothetical protein
MAGAIYDEQTVMVMADERHDSDRAALIYQHATREADQKIADALSERVKAEQKDHGGDGDGLSGVLVPAG